MNTSETCPSTPRGFRRVMPAFVLYFLSPFVAEYLLGDISLNAFWLILFMAPMYGGGALVIREVTRRLGRGWPTMILLAFAYGLIEEGIVIQTLFNPNYLGLHLLEKAYVPALGIGGWWTSFVLSLHTVWSISVPIALTESLFAERRTTPWLGKIGLGVAAFLFLGGCVLLRGTTVKQDPFAASPAQISTVFALFVAVVALALRCRPAASKNEGGAPSIVVVGVISLVLGLTIMTSHMVFGGWGAAAANLAALFIVAGLLLTWSRRAGWTPLHVLMAAAGPLLIYSIYGFPQQPVVGAKGTVDLIGNALFAALAVVLFLVAFRKEQRLKKTTAFAPAVA